MRPRASGTGASAVSVVPAAAPACDRERWAVEMTASVSQAGFFRDVRTVLILALAPAIRLGIARFAYALILPDMRASFGRSYAETGFMNTINAAGTK